MGQSVSANGLPKKLNLGCGWDIRDGYLNVDLHDFHKPDKVADITQLDGLPEGYFQHIVAQDVLEHIERAKTVPALTRWANLLEPNGTLFVRVPSLIDMLSLLKTATSIEREHEVIHLIYGTQAYDGDYHLAGFTAGTLEAQLESAGLLVCNAALRDDWLFEITARKTDALSDPQEIVHHAYFKHLRRPADQGGLAHFVQKVSAGLPPDELNAVLASGEI